MSLFGNIQNPSYIRNTEIKDFHGVKMLLTNFYSYATCIFLYVVKMHPDGFFLKALTHE